MDEASLSHLICALFVTPARSANAIFDSVSLRRSSLIRAAIVARVPYRLRWFTFGDLRSTYTVPAGATLRKMWCSRKRYKKPSHVSERHMASFQTSLASTSESILSAAPPAEHSDACVNSSTTVRIRMNRSLTSVSLTKFRLQRRYGPCGSAMDARVPSLAYGHAGA